MKLQDLINELIEIHSEYGNLTLKGYYDGFWVSDLDSCVDGDYLRIRPYPTKEEEKEIYG